MRMVLRSSLPESSLTTAVGQAVAEINPNVRLNATVGFRASVLDGLARDRMMAWLAGAFGVLAILLAAIGLYGAISYMTSGRRNEIGIRLALGATRGNVVYMIFRQVAILLASGVVLGAAASIIFSGAVRSMVFDLEPADPEVLLSAIGILLLISASAGSIPAIRAAFLSPTIAMRQE
jgi:ABC-type antimicrobial peptide transport system permease subunit